MSLRFILGRAGSGKTYTCLQEIRRELFQAPQGSPLILLVPEQATFQMEKELAATPGLGGSVRAQVLSFRRLAHRILLEVGGAARQHIGDLGKRMVLRKIIENTKHSLKIFAQAGKQPGFADSLANTLSEMKMYGVAPDDLKNILHTLQGTAEGRKKTQLIHKIEDLILLYSELEQYLAGRFTDPDDYLGLVAGKIFKAQSIKDARVWVDGFSGFTPQEYQVLKHLMLAAQQVNIALCMDSSNLDLKAQPEELFFTTKDTYHKITKIAQQELITILEPCCLDKDTLPRFKNNPAIAHLEKYYFTRPAPISDNAQQIKIIAAANPRAEIEGVAREITRLCRDEGYRWNEVSVILRQTGDYVTYIQTIFTDHGIPFFIDQKQPVTHHPLVELVRSALEVVANNWSYESVFRYLKTDFALLSRDEVDKLENYCLAHGIRGTRWIDGKPWTYLRKYTLGEDSPADTLEKENLESINSARERAVYGLLDFYKELNAEKISIKLICEALYRLLENLQVPQQLKDWAEKAENEGQLQKSREHIQIWNDLIAILDEVTEALGDIELSLAEFMQILDTGLDSLRMGLIPPAMDQVLVASLERSRNPNIRAAFVIGVNDGLLPLRPSDAGLINDSERMLLAQAGLELAPDSKRRLLDEQFLIYIALTRASDKLWLSYALANTEGGALMPSMVISRVKELFPSLQESVLAVEPDLNAGIEYITHPERALTYLAGQLRAYKTALKQGQQVSLKDFWWDTYNYCLTAGELKESLFRHIRGLFHTNQEGTISKPLTRKLYGQTIKGSISRLERFAACPFQHFLAYGLKLKERSQYKLAAPDLGQFFHAAVKAVSDMVEKRQLDWKSLDPKACTELTQAAVDELVPQLQNEILLSSERLRYLTAKLRRTVERSMRTLAEHARRGKFTPLALELGFGYDAQLPPLQLKLKDETSLEMGGRIDRIDKAELGNEVYLRIIDFKSSVNKLKLSDICFGTRLQLLTYLDVALENAQKLMAKDAKPAAILYFPMIDPLISADRYLPEEKIEEEILKKMRTQGFVLGDKAVVELMDESIIKDSLLIPVGINKDGGFYAHSSVLTEEQFQALRAYVRHVIQEFAERISAGEVQISPYKNKSFTPCQYCEYKAVCQFDMLLKDNSYRVIPALDDANIWQIITNRLDGGENNG